jgi:hypothetical protein
LEGGSEGGGVGETPVTLLTLPSRAISFLPLPFLLLLLPFCVFLAP